MDVSVELEGFGYTWATGREIVNVQVVLGQNEKSSSCVVALADPTSEVAASLIRHTLTQGGIQKLPDNSDASNSNSAIAPSDISQTSLNGGVEANPKTQKDWELAIVRECLKQGVRDKGQIAYVLGTAQVESTMGQDLENESMPKPYQPRGLVQVYGRGNYAYWSKRLKVDFLAKPDLMKEARYTLPISVLGMRDGTFRAGHKLSRYISSDRQDFYNARLIINGMIPTEANKVKTEAQQYLVKVDRLLAEAGVATAGLTEKTNPKPSDPTEKIEPKFETEGSSDPVVKGNKLKVSVGGLTFEYYHQGTETDQDGITKLSGQGIRWVLSRRKRNKTVQQIKLSQLAAAIAKAHGVRLDYQAAQDLTYDHVDQTGISDYDLLLRECLQAGLFVSESAGVLTVKALANIEDAQLVLAPGLNLISWQIKDEAIDASKEDEGSSLLQAEGKYRLNPVTGQFEQAKLDVDSVPDKSATGKAANKATGTLQPGQEVIAEAARARVKRVKGLPSTFVMPLTPETLALRPLQAVRTKGLNGVLARIWMVDTVKHDFAEGKTALSCFSPIEVLSADRGVDSNDTATTTPTSATTPGAKNSTIYKAARDLYGMSSANAPGTNGGRLACVWAVNAVLKRAGVANLWKHSLAVKAAKAALLKAGYKIAQAEARPGDIALWDGAGGKQHIGIVMANGGASILSNSSSKATFTWTAPSGSYEPYYGAPTEYYRMK